MPTRRADRSFGRNFRPANGQSGPRRTKTIEASAVRSGEANSQDEKIEANRLAHSIDESMGFMRYDSGKKKVGWLCNMHSTSVEDENVPGGRAGVDFYFLEEDGGCFKATVEYDPYFLIAVKRGKEAEVEEWCRRKLEGAVKSIKRVEKEDLQMPNHLLGYRRQLLQLNFVNVGDLLGARKIIMPLAEKNRKNMNAMDTYAEVASANAGFDFYEDEVNELRPNGIIDASDYIVDIREYDVPYHVRVAIDLDIRIGKWYTVEAKHGHVSVTCLEERLTRADPVVLAYDIETTKLPLKFPDAVIDQIMMISYMIDGQGFLITNREIVSEDIADFEYTPKPEYPGSFMIFNEPDERAVLERFFLHIKEAKPTVIATYNGDFFDWPFVEARASVLGIDMYQEIGFRKNSEDIYQSNYCAHMDCFAWVNRDSYLPQGSRGLKAVTVAKLGYDPDELDPELMTPYASQQPQILAEYSVSDAVATYYLYMKYVHPFIFSLCTIIPLGPDDVLRKGTGTLCEMLLMVQAYQKGILLPNKHKEPKETFWDGHLLESETYVGGHVESIEAGVFRSDIPVNFALDTTAIDELIGDLDAALKFSIEVEEKKSIDDVTNYAEVKAEIVAKLKSLKTTPNRNENPSIYHLDVASMYPNIMTTNRLQPDSMIQESDCAACDFNRPGKTCDRRMPWSWRGEFLPAKKNEYNMIRHSLENEKFPGKYVNSLARSFQDLSVDEQATQVKKRLQDYSKKIYHKIHETKTIEREAIICQRENPFYVDTVKNFRDRRYDFKGKQKVWKGKTEALKSAGAPASEIDEGKKMIILFDSLQLAHKVILNSFYGYVMRKGSRWYSMEMAGVTCLTGAHIIQMARELVERIGRPLELDTDGIWCMLPATFPENVFFTMKNGKKMTISYPCTMLNHLVHAKFTNHQYQELVDSKTFKYETHSDNTIFFEVDGPYRAMILPTSKEENKNLKKRYAVFNHDGTLAELKGFEVKRRGELKLIKIFQTQIFKFFLEGSTLQATYDAVAKVANKWLDVLHQHGSTLADEELIDLICENRSMSKKLEEYGAQKSTSITTAKRLAEFLGEQMIKDKGLNCKYIIASRPKGAPVTERAIPVAILSAEDSVKRYFLRKWMKEEPSNNIDPRALIDWDYYLERLGSVIQKLITIPAALQKVRNPVPRVGHPEWLQHRINTKDDRFKQKKMTDLFASAPLKELPINLLNHELPTDLEDFGKNVTQKMRSTQQASTMQKRKLNESQPATVLDPYASLPAKMPSLTEDYEGFLEYQKKKWKIQKQARERRKRLFGERNSVTTADTIGGFARTQLEVLLSHTWHILELRQSESIGIVKAYVLINNKNIEIIDIKVPRQIYLNLMKSSWPDNLIVGCECKKVNHTLPNGHASADLRQLTMSEEVYVDKADEIKTLFNHPSVEGVYEKQVPLTVRALLRLGNLCAIDQSQKEVLSGGKAFDLSALQRTQPKEPYLNPSSLGYLFLYHVMAGDREIFALFSTTKEESSIIVLDKSRNQGFPNPDKLYLDLLKKKTEENRENDAQAWQQNFEYQSNIQFKTTYVTTRRKAFTELSDALKRIHKDKTEKKKKDKSGEVPEDSSESRKENKPMMLVVQSPQRRTLLREVPSFRNFPTVPLKNEASDSSFPPLGWQSFIVKRVLTHYLSLDSWITHLVELARYGGVPLCNMEKDDPRFLIDIAYARMLQKGNVVLWWSKAPRPDHGGHEKDDILGPMETVEMPTVNNSGTYSSVCIELEVRNLAINTILTSSLINELEGADSMESAGLLEGGVSDGTGVLYSENSFASWGIALLRDMVKSWWTDACRGSTMADVMVQHLVRWVENPDSYLYDRSLHFYVQMMSRKAFQQLTTDFKRVGSHIVFADTNRILLQTTKAEVGNAYAYSQYILKSIKAKPLFHFLDLDIKEYWDYLIWYDELNYGGKACQQVVEAEAQTLDTIMHWQLSAFLPQVYQTVFLDWVVEFIEMMHTLKHPQQQMNNDGLPRLTQIPIYSLTNEDGDVPQSSKDMLAKSISKPLKRQIIALISRHRTESTHPLLYKDHIYPLLPGSHLNLQRTNPVLQVVKSLMHIYSLDKSLNLEIRLLRKELLSLFEVREFSQEGRWINPTQSLKLRQWTCENCTMARDLELCNDEDINLDPSATGGEILPASTKDWTCPTCTHPYSRLGIEECLVSQVQKLVTEWQTQDLKCVKCRTVRVNDFMEHCGCGGQWGGTVDREKVVQRLKVLERVGEGYGLRMLGVAVKEVLGGV
ncbi:MAG: DNA polymerase epsilon catalytic subunit [Icmadophila ericetorum]|nr:DNA polymerase epsilon catalytic subunit [Icmadophila ericetorum]